MTIPSEHTGSLWNSRFGQRPNRIKTLEETLKSQKPSEGNPELLKTASFATSDGKTLRATVLYEEGWSPNYHPYTINDFGLVKNNITSRQLIGPGEISWGMHVGGSNYLVANEVREGNKLYNTVIYRYNMDDMKLYDQYNLAPDMMIYTGAYDPVTAKVYVLTEVAMTGGSQSQFMTYDPFTHHFTKIADVKLQTLPVMMFDGQGQLYWHELNNGALYKVNTKTAEKTLVGMTGIQHKYITGGCIDPETNECYIANCTDTEAALYKVSLQTGKAVKYGDMPKSSEISGAYIPTKIPEPTAPGEASDVTFNFEKNALSGTMTLTSPTRDMRGRTLDSAQQLSYTIKTLNQVVASGETTPGQVINVPLEFEKPDTYTFEIVFSNDSGIGKNLRVSQWIGYDVPDYMKRPSLTIKDGKFNLTWETPVSLHGEVLDEASISYRLERCDGVEHTLGSVKTFTEDCPADVKQLTEYYYTIYPIYKGFEYKEIQSNYAYLGAVDEPYSNDINSENSAAHFTVEDTNKDALTWEWAKSENCYHMGGKSGRKKNDWIFTPGVNMKAGHTYPISFELWRELVAYPEKYEVKAGLAPKASAMTEVILPVTNLEETRNDMLQTDLYKHMSFTAPTDGVYYIGIRACSDNAITKIYMDNFSIDYSTVPTTPAAVESFEVTVGALGALNATLSIETPSKDISGNALEAIEEVVILRDGNLIKTLSATPGQLVTYTDRVNKTGWYDYTVACKGSGTLSARSSKLCHIGYDLPLPVDTLRTNVTNYTRVSFDWDPVTTDVNGLAYANNAVDYELSVYQNGEMEPLTTTKDTSIAFDNTMPEQFYFLFGIQPVAAGLKSADYTFADQVLVGKPYTLPYSESFPNASLEHPWFIKNPYSTAFGLWNVYTDEIFSSNDQDPFYGFKSADGDNGFIGYQGFFTDDWSMLFCGNINIDKNLKNPTVHFYHLAQPNNLNTIEVMLKEGEGEWESVASFNLDGDKLGWKEEYVDLSAYAGKVMQLGFKATIINAMDVMFDGIKVYSRPDYNLRLEVAGEETARVGAPATIEYTITNNGLKPMDACKLEVRSKATETVELDLPHLEVGEKYKAVYEYKLNSAAPKSVVFTGKIHSDQDEYVQDNIVKFTIYTEYSEFSAPRQLNAVRNDDGTVDLSWIEPDPELWPVEGGFEGFEGFAHKQMSDFGDWTIYGTGEPKLQLEPMEWPDLNGQAFTYIVFDEGQDIPFIQYDLRAHSGSKFIATVYNMSDAPNDDWLITPELSGESTILNFWARSALAHWLEDIEVLVSTTGKEKEDFTQRLVYDFLVPAQWTNIKIRVPEGAKYVAIRSIAKGKGMLMIDDFDLQNGTPLEAVFLGYNVYRDGEKINETPLQTLTFHDANAKVKQKYNVSALYDISESLLSDAVTVDNSGVEGVNADNVKVLSAYGAIYVSAPAGSKVAIFDMTGRLVANAVCVDGRAKVNVAPGIYAVTVADTHAKVIVK